MQTSLIVIVVIAAVIAVAIAAWYLRKSLLFSKGTYGKQTVKSILKRYALSRNYKVLENVTLNYEGKTQTIDFVLVGFFGLLFVSALQGKGDFYGDLKEPRWSFVDDEKKVRFDNPVLEMDKKIELFRRLMAQKKVYNLKVDSAVVIVGTKSDVPMYLSHMREENIVMTVKEFKRFLEKEKFEKDNNVDVEEIAKLLELKREDVVFALDAILDPVSLYEPVYSDGGDTICVMDQVKDSKNTDESWLEHIALKEAMNRLSDRERHILNLRFFEGKTQMEVSAEVGISQAQVSRLEKSAINQIKKNL